MIVHIINILRFRTFSKILGLCFFVYIFSNLFYLKPAAADDIYSTICQGMDKKQCELKYMTDSEFRKKADQIKNSYTVVDGYACPGMDLLKERYQGDCFPCEIVNVLLASFMRASSKVYDVSREAGNKLLLLGSAIWLAFWALRKLSSFANVEPSSMTNELIIFFGKVLVAYCFINAGIGSLVNFAINPLLGAGAEFGSALLLETEDIKLSSDPKPENQYTGPTDIVSKPVMDKILKLSEGVSNEVATNFIIGSGLTCFSIQKGLHIVVPLIIDIHIPDIWLWLCGAAIWCVGFMLVLAVCYYLIDIPFKIGFAIMALPVVIGLWPFKVTAGKLKSIIGIALNAAFTFLFLALSSSYAIRLMSQAFNAEGNLEYKGQSYSGKEALFKAFEVDDEEYVQSLFDFTGPAFLIILFCYIYGFKMISSITNDYPNKFDTGMTSAAGSPMHHMATAATAWVGSKIAAPFKKGLDIVSHQAGMAATTVTKAAANVGIGAAGAVVGAGTKAMGRGISKVSSRWVDSQKNAKAAADSLDKYNQMNQAGLGTKLQGKMGKVGAAIGLGLANSVNRLGKGMENSGNAMMAPGKDTLNQVVSAGKSGGSEIAAAGAELGGALAETMATITPQALAEKMQQSQRFGALGNKIVQTKSEMKNQAHQGFDTSVEKFTEAGQTLVQNAINTGQSIANGAVNGGQRLASAFSSVKNSVQNINAHSVQEKFINMVKSPVKYVASGAVKMHQQIQNDIQVSKEHARSFGEIGENMVHNFGMVGADFAEAGQSIMHGNMNRNWHELQKTVSDFKDNITADTGIKNSFGAAAVTVTGIGLGIAAVRHLGQNTAKGAEYVSDGRIDDVASAIGTGVVRPSVALGMTVARTASNTFDSAYNLAEGTLLTGIDVARTVLAPVGNVMRATANVGYAIGDTGLALAAGVGDTLGVVGSHLNVAYQYTKYVTKPTTALLVGMPCAIAGKTLGFAAKTVDNTLYGGYRAVAAVGSGTMQVGNVLGRGANVLYHGVKDRTIAGQIAAKTLKSGSKTLKLAAKTLKLGRNVVMAAAHEDYRSKHKETEEERREANRKYLQNKRKSKRQYRQQKRNQEFWDEMDRINKEREDEEKEMWDRYQSENR